MQYKIINEQPFQVLCSSFSISPSQQNYTLNISADGRNYSPLFTVASGQTRLVTGVASGSYYKLVGNQSEVTVNWVRSCNDGGGGSGSGTTYTAGEYISIDQDVISVTGITPSLYATTADTQAIEDHLSDVEYVTATALTELHDSILELSGATGNSNILAAITSQAEYEAISGDVKSGDLIQVQGVVINDDGGPEYGLFVANVDQGSISWNRVDNVDSLLWSGQYYPWMVENDVNPIDLGVDTFLICNDMVAGDEAYNGIGFDANGKPVITHIVPQYDEQTGEVTGMTREDVALGPDEAKEQVIATALVNLNEKKVESEGIHYMVALSQADYDDLVSGGTVDSRTFYIITGSTSN